MLPKNENKLAAAGSALGLGQVTFNAGAVGHMGTVTVAWAGVRRTFRGFTQGSTAHAFALHSCFPTPLTVNIFLLRLLLPCLLLCHLHAWSRGLSLAVIPLSFCSNPIF